MGFALKMAQAREGESGNNKLRTQPLSSCQARVGRALWRSDPRARNWRTMALLSGVTALLATGGVVWLSARSRVVPFVVLMDSLGRPVASGMAEQASGADDRLKRAEILNWVENLRLVTTDAVAQRKAVDRVYAHIASGSHAQTFISEFYRADPPFKRAQTDTVAVEVKSVLPTSDRTYEVEWIETTRDLYGAIKATDHWKGSFSIALNPPTDEASGANQSARAST